MRASVILVMLPLAVYNCSMEGQPMPAPKPSVVAVPATTEGMLAFNDRWPVRGQMLPVSNTVRTISFRNEEAAAPPVPQSKPVAPVVRTYVRRDKCARHGLRKVQYGKRWRCRR